MFAKGFYQDMNSLWKWAMGRTAKITIEIRTVVLSALLVSLWIQCSALTSIVSVSDIVSLYAASDVTGRYIVDYERGAIYTYEPDPRHPQKNEVHWKTNKLLNHALVFHHAWHPSRSATILAHSSLWLALATSSSLLSTIRQLSTTSAYRSPQDQRKRSKYFVQIQRLRS
jgi:hypothetical protein